MDSDNTVEQQEAMAFLREGFLQLLSKYCAEKRPCQISMYENTNIKCNIRASDANFQNIIVENLVTPLPPVLPIAILRTGDIIAMKVEEESLPDKK